MGIYAITGATSGIGAATKKLLEERGDKVINIDIKGQPDIQADLATKEGREKALEELYKLAPEGLDCFIANAGVGPTETAGRIVSLNYYGAKEMTEGVKELLKKKGGNAVVTSSNSATMFGLVNDFVNVMCDGNSEEQAVAAVSSLEGHSVFAAYQASKFAIAKWVRRVSASWITEGVRINSVAPGSTWTPLLEGLLDSPYFGPGCKIVPIPTKYRKYDSIPITEHVKADQYIAAEEIAKTMLFVASKEASALNGTVVFADGGTDALTRSERF